ncbi:MAG: hypothetical protein IPK53_11690 [bacterium]|nr:hypothetical protein [bacterium]
MEEEQTETNEVTYEIDKEANVARFFAYEIEMDEEGFIYDDDENLLGAVVHFESYPDNETLTTIFDDLLVSAVMHTQNVDEDDAAALIESCDDDDDFPEELDVSSTFSLLFTVNGHRGLYRTLLDSNDYWTGHSSGVRGDRWDI